MVTGGGNITGATALKATTIAFPPASVAPSKARTPFTSAAFAGGLMTSW